MKNRVRYLLYSSFFFFSSSFIFAQQDTGFTDKAQAKNLKVNNLKDGNWVEYYKLNNGFDIETKNTKAPFYRLVVYKEGKPAGLAREYYKSGKLRSIIPYKNGAINGILKEYNESGELIKRDTIIDNFEKGVILVYYPGGQLKSEVPFVNDRTNSGNIFYDDKGFCTHGMTNGVARSYYESGKLKGETAYTDGERRAIKNYDENGKEIK